MFSEIRFMGKVVALFALCLFVMNGCGGKDSQEKMTEQGHEKATGKDVDVNSGDGKIQITGDDSKTEFAETTTWPSELTSDVPKFEAGSIKRVIKTIGQNGEWTFNIYIEAINDDDLKEYETSMKGKGWQTELIQIEGQGGYLNGQKGTMGMNFMLNREKKDGMLAVYNRP